MSLKSAAVKTAIAAIALTALGVVAAAPASAHTNNMYTFMRTSEVMGFATYSKTDGTAAYLGTTYPVDMIYLAGIEIANEVGTVLGYGEVPFVQQWDHKTGEVSAVAPTVILTIADADYDYFLENLVGLDTLNSGTTVTVAAYSTDVEGPFNDHYAISSANATNGQVIPLVDFTPYVMTNQGEFLYEPTSIATDPLTGLTYVFLEDQAGLPWYLAVDVATGTIAAPILLDGAYFVEGALVAADFESDGTLFANYENYAEENQLELLKLGAVSTWATGEPTYISLAPGQFPDARLYEHSLTIEHTALADTGSELPVLAIVLAGTVAVVAGGVTVVAARRRSEAGTV